MQAAIRNGRRERAPHWIIDVQLCLPLLLPLAGWAGLPRLHHMLVRRGHAITHAAFLRDGARRTAVQTPHLPRNRDVWPKHAPSTVTTIEMRAEDCAQCACSDHINRASLSTTSRPVCLLSPPPPSTMSMLMQKTTQVWILSAMPHRPAQAAPLQLQILDSMAITASRRAFQALALTQAPLLSHPQVAARRTSVVANAKKTTPKAAPKAKVSTPDSLW